MGTRFEVDPELVIPNPKLSLHDGAIAPWASGRSKYFQLLIRAVAEENAISMETPWDKLPAKSKKIMLNGIGKKKITVNYTNRYGRSRDFQATFEGVVPNLRRRHLEAATDKQREQIEGYMREIPCPDCKGARLRPMSLAVTINDLDIATICNMSIKNAATTLMGIELSKRDEIIANPILKEINSRMGFLLDVGLEYLSLHRAASTLSGGEAQRSRLASQIGAG